MIGIVERETTQLNQDQNQKDSSLYGCEILFEKTTFTQIKDPSLPNDAYVVIYRYNNETYMDLCRGPISRIFDLYYDTYGPNSIKAIEWGYGRANPRTWNLKTNSKKKNG